MQVLCRYHLFSASQGHAGVGDKVIIVSAIGVVR